jgi:hypothetical protein
MAPIDQRVIGVTPISRMVNNSQELTPVGGAIGSEQTTFASPGCRILTKRAAAAKIVAWRAGRWGRWVERATSSSRIPRLPIRLPPKEHQAAPSPTTGAVSAGTSTPFGATERGCWSTGARSASARTTATTTRASCRRSADHLTHRQVDQTTSRSGSGTPAAHSRTYDSWSSTSARRFHGSTST